jgi:two-component system, NarL family, nitrate/nitrite sensor histidine kinase NarX
MKQTLDKETLLKSRINKLEAELEQAHTKIAQEIHDSLAQTLASLKLRVEVLERNLLIHNAEPKIMQNANKVKHGINLANDEIRELIKNFRAPKIQSFHSSMRSLVNDFKADTKTKVFLQYNCGSLPFDIDTKTQIYRIIQEALSNVKKHSQAKFVRVMLSCADGMLNVLIEDDGVGFAGDKLQYDAEKHIGLAVMHERAEKIDATVEVESEPGEGCQVKIAIPMRPPQYDLEFY